MAQSKHQAAPERSTISLNGVAVVLAGVVFSRRTTHIEVTEDALIVDFTDGRTASVPLAWYPRLLHGSPEERANWRFIGNGEGIHWPDLDEDISVENILLWQPSQESQASFKRWLQARTK